MKQLPPSIRKAAILVSALDDRAADALLEQMGDEAAARVRSALVELDQVSPAEQQQVLSEFFQGSRSQSSPPRSREEPNHDGVELDVQDPENLDVHQGQAVTSGPFTFLRDVPRHLTARVLSRESAQTIAVVLAHVAADLAAEILENLPPNLATDVLERLACLYEPAADAIAEIGAELRRQLALVPANEAPVQSLAALRALIGAMQSPARQRVLAALDQRNTVLARELGHTGGIHAVSTARYRIEACADTSGPDQLRRLAVPLFEFDDLEALGNQELRQVLAAADPQVALLALTGASSSLLERILSQLSPAQAKTLRSRLNHPGAVRLSEIESAQEQVAGHARRLAEQGVIALPGNRRFTEAA